MLVDLQIQFGNGEFSLIVLRFPIMFFIMRFSFRPFFWNGKEFPLKGPCKLIYFSGFQIISSSNLSIASTMLLVALTILIIASTLLIVVSKTETFFFSKQWLQKWWIAVKVNKWALSHLQSIQTHVALQKYIKKNK